MTASQPPHRVHIASLCILILIGGAALAQVPSKSDSSPDKPVAEQEPIAPIPPPPAADPRKLALGARLFSDSRLSGNGELSCSSCHDVRSNGARSDGAVSHPFDTLTVFNAALSFRLNWEGNYRTLAAHVESSLGNPVNMHTLASMRWLGS